MSAYRKIVAGVHDSVTGRRAAQYTAQAAAELSAELILVAAYQPDSRAEVAESLQAAGPARARAALDMATEICTDGGVTPTLTLAVPGDPVSVLSAAGREHEADLVVVGSYGLASLGGRLLGSVPAGVSREAPCDVLVVHTTTDRWRRLLRRRPRRRLTCAWSTIVVGVHDTDRSRRAADQAAQIAAERNATLVLVGVFQTADRKELAYVTDTLRAESHLGFERFGVEDALRCAEERARDLGVATIERVLMHGDAMTGLLKTAAKREADLLVMGNHQLTGRAAQLLGSVTSTVSRKCPTHILLVH